MRIKRISRNDRIIASIVLMFALLSSAFFVFSNTSTVKAQTTSIPSDMLQYEWPSGLYDPSHTLANPGPGPSAPNIAWKAKVPGATGYPIAFGGKIFVSGTGATYALDGGTGQIIWKNNVTGTTAKLSNDYLIIGNTCVKASDGTTVWVYPGPYNAFMQLAQALQSFSTGVGYVPELKMILGGRNGAVAWNLPDPSKPPTLAWNLTDQLNVDYGFPLYGDGKFFLGSNDGFLKAFDAKTGAALWTAPASSMFFYSFVYYQGKVIHGGLDNNVRCWDANTGKLLWTYNPQTWYGQWSLDFAAANGMIYGKNQDTYLYAINAETGQLVWRQKGPGIGYANHVTVAGDKIYTAMGEYQYRDFETGEYAFPEFNCYDALTGKLLWSLPLENGAPSNMQCNAYGNLYLIPTTATPSKPGYWAYTGQASDSAVSKGEVWCISSTTIDWPMFMANAAHTAEGAGPTNLALKWKFTTSGTVVASPSMSKGICYVGSVDGNVYALDAYTGVKKWSFQTGAPVVASVAVVNGKVYTGTESGSAFCLDAATGSQLWKTSAGGISKNVLWPGIAVVYQRSSPIVVNNKVYVGALDGNMYCLDANTGSVQWKCTTQGPIYAAPAVVDNAVYFPSSTGGYPVGQGPNATEGQFYKVDVNTGNVIWKKAIPYVLNRTGNAGNFLLASPTVAAGMVFVRNGFYENYALDANTGDIKWTTLARFNNGTRAQWGGVVQINAPLYAYGILYMNDYYGLVALNATSGKELWFAWLSRENICPALAYAYGRIYTVNDLGVIYVLDAVTGEKLSYYEVGAYQMHSAPSLYDGNMYVGCHDFNVYCFGDARLMAASNGASPKPSQTTIPTSIVSQSPSHSTQTPGLAVPAEALYAVAIIAAVIIAAVAAILLRKRKK